MLYIGTESLNLIPQLLQAVLVGSSALAGFAGLIVIQLVQLSRDYAYWDRFLVGILSLVNGISFVICIVGAISWFNDNIESNLNMARNSFLVQAISFLLLFTSYILVNYFSEK
jgi:hypothetical protein